MKQNIVNENVEALYFKIKKELSKGRGNFSKPKKKKCTAVNNIVL